MTDADHSADTGTGVDAGPGTQTNANAGTQTDAHPSALPTPPAWLDDIDGDEALAWAREQNARTEAVLDTPRRGHFEESIRQVLDNPDRIPAVTVRDGWAFNFWTDGEHPRGLWRRQRFDDYLAESDDWEVLLDVDALSAEEGRSWVWHGAQVLRGDWDRALVTLSDGGSDADETREFDIPSRSFVEDGFRRGPSKGSMSWIDRDNVWWTDDFGEGSVSASGYPLRACQLNRLTRTPRQVLQADATDMSVWAGVDRSPGFERSVVTVAHDFHHFTSSLVEDDGSLREIPIPKTSEAILWRDWVMFLLREPWDGAPGAPEGTLIAFDREELMGGAEAPSSMNLFTPTPEKVLGGIATTRDHLVLTMLDDVLSEVEVLTPADGEWTRTPLDVAGDGDEPLTVRVRAFDQMEDNRLWVSVNGFATPSTLMLIDLDETGDVRGRRVVRQAPAMYDAAGISVERHFATSDDGTRVPYFQVGRPRRDGDAPTPTVLDGYGGFEISLLPGYAPVPGRALLERGGTYVQACIRGGGEYGPAWHQAALRQNRHRAYEDFAAVARDLVARGVCEVEHLGCTGGSNGGLLVGNMLTTYPDLFGAIVCRVPLLDMRRFSKLLAGASWVSEYGDPDDPEQWKWLQRYSPFHQLRAGAERGDYPPVLFTTSTRDDRVHPAHARTMAWRMQAMGLDALYYESIEGGHGGAADNRQRAHVSSLVWEYLWQRLG